MKYNNLAYLFIALLFASCTDKIPEVNFEMSYEGEVAPVTVTFKNSSKNAEGYSWDFGDGTGSVTDAEPTHTFNGFGEFTVTLTAVNGSESVETTQKINIKQPPVKSVEIITSKGTMIAELSNYTPQHRDNFIKLANEKFFDGLLYHRVMKNFMIQGGDPDSRNAPAGQRLGQGGPGYTVPAEMYPGKYHYKGALAAARTENPQKASSGSQFYIVHGRAVDDNFLSQVESKNRVSYSQADRSYYKEHGGTPGLDNLYTVFGNLISGFEVLDAIADVKVSDKGGDKDRPLTDVKIVSIRVIE